MPYHPSARRLRSQRRRKPVSATLANNLNVEIRKSSYFQTVETFMQFDSEPAVQEKYESIAGFHRPPSDACGSNEYLSRLMAEEFETQLLRVVCDSNIEIGLRTEFLNSYLTNANDAAICSPSAPMAQI